MVLPELPMLMTTVRFRSPAPQFAPQFARANNYLNDNTNEYFHVAIAHAQFIRRG